jgi:hypothetical protein
MEHTEPPEPSREGAEAEPDEPADVLRRLEQRLDRASDAAERLLAEAARASAASAARLAESAARAARPGGAKPAGAAPAGGEGEPAAAGGEPAPARGQPRVADANPPPAGWQTRSDDARADFEVLSQVMQSLRELIPPELQRRLADALRELLLALRALIDWYLERIDQRRAEPAEVQDIPIL